MLMGGLEETPEESSRVSASHGHFSVRCPLSSGAIRRGMGRLAAEAEAVDVGDQLLFVGGDLDCPGQLVGGVHAFEAEGRLLDFGLRIGGQDLAGGSLVVEGGADLAACVVRSWGQKGLTGGGGGG